MMGLVAIPASAADSFSLSIFGRAVGEGFDNPWDAGLVIDTAAGNTVTVTGNGTYSVTFRAPSNRTFATLSMSDSRFVNPVDDNVVKGTAAPLSAALQDVTITLDSIVANGNNLTLRFNRDISLTGSEDLSGYAHFQLWNAWSGPNAHPDECDGTGEDQRIVPNAPLNINTAPWGEKSALLSFGANLATLTVNFTVSGFPGGDDGGDDHVCDDDCDHDHGHDHGTPPSDEFDGTYRTGDAMNILRIAAGLMDLTPELLEIYDLNKDGEITTADALLVLQLVAGLITLDDLDCDDDCDDHDDEPDEPGFYTVGANGAMTLNFAAIHPVIGESGGFLRTAGINPPDVALNSSGHLVISNRSANWQGIDFNFAALDPGTYTLTAVVTSPSAAEHQIDTTEEPWNPKAAGPTSGTRVTHTMTFTVRADGSASTPAGDRTRVRFNTTNTTNFTIESIVITPA
jgi:hypothetical protein